MLSFSPFEFETWLSRSVVQPAYRSHPIVMHPPRLAWTGIRLGRNPGGHDIYSPGDASCTRSQATCLSRHRGKPALHCRDDRSHDSWTRAPSNCEEPVARRIEPFHHPVSTASVKVWIGLDDDWDLRFPSSFLAPRSRHRGRHNDQYGGDCSFHSSTQYRSSATIADCPLT